MKARPRLKQWMGIVGAAGLLAGIPIGFALAEVVRAKPLEDTFQMERFKKDLRLDGSQMHQIRRVLAVREREIRQVYAGFLDELPAELWTRIETIKRRADERIRAVLDTTQLAQYRKARQIPGPR